MRNVEEYADVILKDEGGKIAWETPTVYETDRIERIYEFRDGAAVKYEWQGIDAQRASNEDIFNHRFTLETPPTPNPNRFKRGVIRVINYPAFSARKFYLSVPLIVELYLSNYSANL
jgi:hypothetical protein